MRLRWCATVAALALLATACGGGDDTGSDTTTSESSGGLTEPGTELDLGHPAVVEFAPNAKHHATVQVVVKSVERGKVSDLSEFDLGDAAKSSSVYYVDLTVQKVGGGNVSGEFITMFGKVTDTMVVQPVSFGSSYKRCDDQPIPAGFAVDDKLKTCLVFLAPDRGTISAVEWRNGDDGPISWVVGS